MKEDIYRKLQEHLNQHPMGFPATQSGVEIKLLQKLFEENEAHIALMLIPEPQTVNEISMRFNIDPANLEEKLDTMATKGLIMRKRKGDAVFFYLIPMVVGFYEFQIGRTDRGFFDLFNTYVMEGLGAELFGSETSYIRVVPVEGEIQDKPSTVLSHEAVSKIIGESEKVAVTDCICRTKAKTLGNGCNHTVRNCICLSPLAEYYMENGYPGRYVSKVDALAIIDEAEKEGLVHLSQNTATGNEFICNCCKCCCSFLNGINAFKLHDRVVRSTYFSEVDDTLCTGCEDCIERCPFNAISMTDGTITIDHQFCMGCGLCISACSTGALSMVKKPDEKIVNPPSDLENMYERIGREKGRSMKVVLGSD